MIFNLAYPSENYKPIPMEVRENAERAIRGLESNYVVRLTALNKVSKLLVSKQYFMFAAKAFVCNQPFRLGLGRTPNFPSLSSPHCSGIATQYLTSLSTSLSMTQIGLQDAFPNLRHLTVVIWSHDFDSIEHRSAWQHTLTDGELESVINKVHAAETSGMVALKIITAEILHYPAEFIQSTWDQNVQRLSESLRRIVTRPREFSPIGLLLNKRRLEYNKLALYPDSKVFMSNPIAKGTEPPVRPLLNGPGAGLQASVEESERRWSDLPDSLPALKKMMEDDGNCLVKFLKDRRVRELWSSVNSEEHQPRARPAT